MPEIPSLFLKTSYRLTSMNDVNPESIGRLSRDIISINPRN